MKINTRQLTLTAVLAAMCTVLGGFSLRLGGSFEFSFESVPVHVAALLFGPAEGALAGGIGAFVYQVLLSGYGITATTPLWILPYVMCGVVTGMLTRRGVKMPIVFLASELTVTGLNTVAIAADALLYSYYSTALVFGALAVKVVICAAKAIAYGALLPRLIKPLKGVVRV